MTSYFFVDSQLFKLTPQGLTEFLTLSNGGTDAVQEAVTFQVDTATGNMYSTGSINIFAKNLDGTADQGQKDVCCGKNINCQPKCIKQTEFTENVLTNDLFPHCKTLRC